MRILEYLLARFSEPSSYAGLGALFAVVGWNLSDSILGQLAQLLAGGCALLALVLKERGMIRAIVLVFAVIPTLAGCAGVPAAVLGGLGSAGSAYAAVDRITEAATPYIAANLSSIESFGDAICGTPPVGDPLSTAIWLGQLAGQLTTLASVAKAGG